MIRVSLKEQPPSKNILSLETKLIKVGQLEAIFLSFLKLRQIKNTLYYNQQPSQVEVLFSIVGNNTNICQADTIQQSV